MINNELYQIIFDEIISLVEYAWDKLVIYLEYGESSYSFAFYVKNQNKYINCYDIKGLSDKEIREKFRIIDEVVAPERDTLKEKWSSMTMVVSSDGDMQTDFDYTDLSQGTYQYMKDWKIKYLI